MLAAADEQTVADWVGASSRTIVHTAAPLTRATAKKHPDESYRANVLLPCWMAAAAQKRRKAGCVQFDQVYTGLTEHGPFDEDTPLSPPTSMAATSRRWSSACWIFCPMPCCCGAWMYDLPGYGLPIRGNFLLNLLTAAMRQETLRFSMQDYRGITYVRGGLERLTQAMELPGGVYNFGSENDCDMVTTARRACALLDIHPVIEAADWPRSLLMDGGRFRAAAGVGFDDTLMGVQRCLRDYGLLK